MRKLFFIMTMFCAIVMQAQNGYIRQTIQLPFSNNAKEYLVKKVGELYILNGDIVVGSTYQHTRIYQANEPGQAYIWARGNVPVLIDKSMESHGMLNDAKSAIDILNRQTNLRLSVYNKEKDYIKIMYSPETGFGGVSPVGRKGGEQIIYITREASVRTIVHELLHSLGFWHEQSRYDRDNHIWLDTSNVSPEQRHNFQIEPGVASLPYDYNSIMHYSSTAFAIDKNKPTIQCKRGNVVSKCELGPTNGYLSPIDIQGINASYAFNAGQPRIDYWTDWEIAKANRDLLRPGADMKIKSVARTSNDITDGIYKIKINHTGKYLAVEGKDKRNGAKLIQWNYEDDSHFRFKVKKRDDGTYEISALHSGRFISAAGNAKADGTYIIQWDWANENYLKWNLYYDDQKSAPGWVMQHNGSSPIQLQGGVLNSANGQPLVLKQQQRQDAHDYDAVQTFTFERVGEIPTKELQERRVNPPKQFGVRKANQ